MQNISNPQRVIRVVVGVLILALGYFYQSNWGYIGLIPLLTGLIGNCPMCYLGNLPICMKKSGEMKEKSSCEDENCKHDHE